MITDKICQDFLVNVHEECDHEWKENNYGGMSCTKCRDEIE